MVVTAGDRTYRLSRTDAVELRAALTDALQQRREFVHTVGITRPDGTYRVERRGADSAGQAKVFESLEALAALYRSLPREFTARDLDADGLSGSRRHLVVRHLVEHPAFECELAARQPLTARKRDRPA